MKSYPIENFPKYTKEKTGKAVLDGDLDFSDKIEVCKIKKDKYCLANDNCPDDKKEKKRFFTGHSILWYVKKDDPRGDSPKDPEDDPQFKNWEEAIKDWAKDSDDYSDKAAPTKDCKSSDFSDSGSDSGS